MARLIQLREFNRSEDSTGDLNPLWYFPDAYWEYNNRRICKFTIESGYPVAIAMHQDRFNDQIWQSFSRRDSYTVTPGQLRMEIRRWVERNLSTDVILEQIEMNYRLWNRKSKDYHCNFEDIKHGYYLFHFETESEAMMFRLKFSEHIDEMQPVNPRETWRTEENGWYTTLYD